MNNIAIRLRAAVSSVRSKSYPLSDLIPMMQEAADRIDELEAKSIEQKCECNQGQVCHICDPDLPNTKEQHHE